MQSSPDPVQIQHMIRTMMPFFFLLVVFGWALLVVPFWQIFKKAGMGGPLSLLMIVPLVNLIMLYVLAFSRWKVVPVPEYAMGYPPTFPPPGYVPAAPVYPPATAAPQYPPPPDTPASI